MHTYNTNYNQLNYSELTPLALCIFYNVSSSPKINAINIKPSIHNVSLSINYLTALQSFIFYLIATTLKTLAVFDFQKFIRIPYISHVI